MNQLKKLNISETEIFEEGDLIIKNYIKSHSENSLDITNEKENILKNWKLITIKANSLDPTYSKALLAEMHKMHKNIDHISHRFIRIEKQKKETEINKISKLKEKLFPGNGLQERYDNFIQYYVAYGDGFIETLINTLDPFDNTLTLIIEE